MRGAKAKRIQWDQIWAFCYAKEKNVETAKAASDEAGDLWTSTAIDADSKLLVSYLIGGRDAKYANDLMQDVSEPSGEPGSASHGWPESLPQQS